MRRIFWTWFTGACFGVIAVFCVAAITTGAPTGVLAGLMAAGAAMAVSPFVSAWMTSRVPRETHRRASSLKTIDEAKMRISEDVRRCKRNFMNGVKA